MQKVLQCRYKLIRLAGDVLNCLGKTIKDSDARIINSLLIHGQS